MSIGVSLLGSTGSIGSNALAVIRQHPERFKVYALSAHTAIDKLFQQCCEFQPAFAVMTQKTHARALQMRLQAQQIHTKVLWGEAGFTEIASLTQVQKVLAAIVGGAGLLPTLSAVNAGKEVLLANKEALVMAGDLMMRQAEQSGAKILPVDSEHNALFQCLPEGYRTFTRPLAVARLILTASGGPFLHYSEAALERVTPEMASVHPNWEMGKKITVDCATLMNKGLEVIEACKLFQFTAEEVKVLIHPQSIVHSMVEYLDGSVLAQMSVPDMKIPIAYCLSWPNRITTDVPSLSLADGTLSFCAPDRKKFKCLDLAYRALSIGKGAPTVLNASNEIAVDAFLSGKLRFTAIPTMIETVMEQLSDHSVSTLEEILAVDKLAREASLRWLHTQKGHACLEPV